MAEENNQNTEPEQVNTEETSGSRTVSEPETTSEDPRNNPFSFAAVKRLNHKAILFIIGLLLLLVIYVIMLGLYGSQPTALSNKDEIKKPGSNTSKAQADLIIGGRRTGITQGAKPPEAPKGGMTGEDKKTEEKPSQQNTAEPQQPKYQLREPIKLELQNPPKVDDVDAQLEKQETKQIRQMKIEKFRNAVNAGTKANFSTDTHSRISSPDQQRDQLSQDKRKLEQLQSGGADALFNQRMAQLKINSGGLGGAAGLDADSGISGGNNRQLTAFESQTPDPTRWILKSQVLRPAKYSILTGTVIPATMVTGINSDLPGQVTAQVSQNVYDTARGKYLLIPQGSRLIGGYSANVIYGQERLLLGWQRIIFPDGRSIDIGSMPGTDQSGYSGVTDDVNNHYVRLFGSSLMLSVISAGAAWAADRNSHNTDSQTFSNTFASSAGSEMSQTSTELIRKNMNIAPTLTVRPGFRINVMVTKDITVLGTYEDYKY